MGRPPKWIADEYAAFGLPPMLPLRQYWREINRQEREAKAQERAAQKKRGQRRPKCRCEAYKFPHRPGGGLCRYPDPPAVRWEDAQAAEIAWRVGKYKAMHGEPSPVVMGDLIGLTTRLTRPYRKRYAGLRRQIAQANGLHPIRDRAAIERLLPRALSLAKQLHRQHPKYKYRNIEITDNGVTGRWTTAGPTM